MISRKELLKEFPQLSVKVNGRRLVYLDSAATTMKPRSVIEKMRKHLELGAANVHRGAHHLSDLATDEFETVRARVANFINAKSSSEIVFTQGTTHGLNLIAQTLGRTILNEGDEILVTQMEHHSNIVPWQMIAKEKRAFVRFAPVNAEGLLDTDEFAKMLSPRTKIVSVVQLSNALGNWNDVKKLATAAKKVDAYFVVDAAQSISARKVDVQDLGCDFLVFSGHKLFGPTGVGVLYGKEQILAELPPFFGGGSMIHSVDEAGSTFLPPPHRFEAGTPPIVEVLGLGEAIRFFSQLDLEELEKNDHEILAAARSEIAKIDGMRVWGNEASSHVLSFVPRWAHPSDVGAMLNEEGIAVRTGHHCCQPLMAKLGISGTVRASFSIYSTEEDVERLIEGLKKVKGFVA